MCILTPFLMLFLTEIVGCCKHCLALRFLGMVHSGDHSLSTCRHLCPFRQLYSALLCGLPGVMQLAPTLTQSYIWCETGV